MKVPVQILARKHEITREFQIEVDKHLEDILSGATDVMFEIRDFAEIMHIHPTHLSNTIKTATGHSPCYFFENKIMEHAKTLLRDMNTPIGEIARILTYDPSNFTKFFKHFSGTTPKKYREAWFQSEIAKTETVTI